MFSILFQLIIIIKVWKVWIFYKHFTLIYVLFFKDESYHSLQYHVEKSVIYVCWAIIDKIIDLKADLGGISQFV